MSRLLIALLAIHLSFTAHAQSTPVDEAELSQEAVELQIGDEVLVRIGFWAKVLTIEEFSKNGRFKMSNGRWYHARHIIPLVESYNGISVGDLVIEKSFFRSRQYVEAISSDGGFLLEDGYWYHWRFIELF